MSLTMIEALVAKANNEPGHPGYHVSATFPDGSYINAPITRVGSNWAAFAELDDDEVLVDLTGAVISIDWAPGAAEAMGSRFAHLSVSENSSSGAHRL